MADLRAPAEAAAGQHGLELHVLGLQAEHAGDGLVLDGLELAAEAGQRLLAIPAQVAVQRLHRRVRQVGEHELGLDHAIGAGEHGFGIAVRAGNRARLPGKRAKLLDELRAAALLGRRSRPR